MPINPPNPPAPPRTYTVLDIVTNALIEAEWLAPGETPNQEEGDFAFNKLNDLLDQWAADDQYIYSVGFQLFTLVPQLNPHTIGPQTATFTAAIRPIRVESAAIVLNSSNPSTDIPIPIQDDDWWAQVRIKDQQSTIPTSLYYSPDWPNGQLFFWPVPQTAYQVRLELWNLISQFALITDDFSMPPAYRRALTLTLAEELAGPRSGDPGLVRKAYEARSVIRSNNNTSPRISTIGVAEDGGTRTRFNYLTGQPW